MSRSLTWSLRAGFALIALVLLAVIANGRASAALDAETERAIAESGPVFLTGRTFPGAPADAMLDRETGRIEGLSFSLRLRCAPARYRRMFVTFFDLAPTRAGDRDAGNVLRLRRPAERARLPWRLQGTATLAFDARYDARHLTGTASTRVLLADGGTCRADDVPVRLSLPG